MKTTIIHGPTASIAALCSLILPLTLTAADNHMLIHVKNGVSPHRIEMSGQTRISFSNATMNIVHPAGNISIDLSDIDHMAFDLQTSSADEIDAPLSGEINFNVAGRNISATSACGNEVCLHIYDTSGRVVATVNGRGSVEFDFSDYASGIYIILCNGQTIKYLNH